VLPTEATSMLLLQATANEGVSIEDVERAVDEEISRLGAGGPSDEELERAQTRAEVEFAHQIENYDSRADMIGMLSTYFNDPRMLERWLSPYQQATKDDLARVTREMLVAENRVTIHFLPEAA